MSGVPLGRAAMSDAMHADPAAVTFAISRVG